MSSRAVTIAAALRAELATILGPEVSVVRVFVPSFTKSKAKERPIVAVRPAARSFTREGKVLGPLDTILEIGIVRRPDPPASADTDPDNDLDQLDPIDELCEKIFDLFVPFDEDEIDAGDTAGALAEKELAGHLPRDVSQATTVDVQHLAGDRDWIAVITVTYRRQL